MSQLHATEAEKSPAMLALDELVKERVLEGIKFLRRTYGEDWVDHIDMEILNLSDGDVCVLGQVHPAYYETTAEECGFTAATETFVEVDRKAMQYGFIDGHQYGFGPLQRAWEEVIPGEKIRLERLKASGQVKCESSASTTSKAAS